MADTYEEGEVTYRVKRGASDHLKMKEGRCWELDTNHFKDRLGDFCRKFSIAYNICSMLNRVKKIFQPLFLQIKLMPLSFFFRVSYNASVSSFDVVSYVL